MLTQTYLDIQSKDIIKDTSALNITDFEKFQTITSPDLNYTILWDPTTIITIDNLKKELISKKVLKNYISNLKVQKHNYLSYTLDDDEGSCLVTSPIECLENKSEIKRKDSIFDYVIMDCIEKGKDVFYLYIDYTGEMHICLSKEKVHSLNLMNDINFFTEDYNKKIQLSDICKIHFDEKTQNLLIFFKQGKMFSYYIDTNYLKETIRGSFDYSINDYLKKSNTGLDYNSISVLKRGKLIDFIDANGNANFDIEIASLKSFNFNNSDYLIVGYNNNNKIAVNKQVLQIFQLNPISKDLISFHEYLPLKKTIELLIETKKNIYEENEYTQLKNYKLLSCGYYNSEISASFSLNENHADTIVFLVTEDNKNFHIFNLNLKKLIKNSNLNLNPFQIKSFSSFIEKGYTIKQINLLGCLNENFEDNKKQIWKFSLRFFLLKNALHAYSFDKTFSNKENLFENNFIVSQDVSKYLEYYKNYKNFIENNLDKKTKNLDEILEKEIIKKIKFEYKFQEDWSFRKMFINLNDMKDEKKNKEKFDLYLAYLITCRNFMSIKDLINLRDVKNGYFIISNEKLFFTVKKLFDYFTFEYLQFIKIEDYGNLLNNNFEEIFKIFCKLLYICKSRAEKPMFIPFKNEEEIQLENSYKICVNIENFEAILLIVKIFKNYFKYKSLKMKFDKFDLPDLRYFNSVVNLLYDSAQYKFTGDIRFIYIEIIEKILKTDIDNFYKENKEKNISKNITKFNINSKLNDSLYLFKFVLYFIYTYLIIFYKSAENFDNINTFSNINLPNNNNSSINNSNSDNDTNNIKFNQMIRINLNKSNSDKDFFQKLKDTIELDFLSNLFNETLTYLNLVYNFVILDALTKDHINQYKNFKINSKIFSEFFYFFNKENYEFTLSKLRINKHKFNENFLNLLIENKHITEAGLISKKISENFKTFEEYNCLLEIYLKSGLKNFAYELVNYCFACRVELKNLNFETKEKIKFFGELKKIENFSMVLNLYEKLFSNLIRNKEIKFLFNLPLNFIERFILRELILTQKNENLENLLIIYDIKMNDKAHLNEHREKLGNLISKDIEMQYFKRLFKVMDVIFDNKNLRNNNCYYDNDNDINFRNEFKEENFNASKISDHNINIIENNMKMDIDVENGSAKRFNNNLNNKSLSQRIKEKNFVQEENISGLGEANFVSMTLNESMLNDMFSKKIETAKKTMQLYSDSKEKVLTENKIFINRFDMDKSNQNFNESIYAAPVNLKF